MISTLIRDRFEIKILINTLVNIKLIFQEAGIIITSTLIFLNILNSLLEILGLSIALQYFLKDKNWELSNLYLFSNNILLFLFFLIFIRGLAKSFVQYYSQKIKLNYEIKLKEEFFKQVISASICDLNKISRGDLLGVLLTDIGRTVFAYRKGLDFLMYLLSFLIYTIAFLKFNFENYLSLLIGIFATLLAVFFNKSNSIKLGKMKSEINSNLNKIIGDGLNGIKTIRGIYASNWFFENFKKQNKHFKINIFKFLKKEIIFKLFRDLLIVIFLFLMIISINNIQIDKLILLIVLTYKTATNFSKSVKSQRQCFTAVGGYTNLIKIRKIIKHNEEKSNMIFRKKLEGYNFNFLSFKWNSNISNYNFLKKYIFKKGELIVITGPSGSGKSTLLDNLSGLSNEYESEWIFENAQGKKHFFRVDKSFTKLNSLINYSPQNSKIFETSIFNNLLFDSELCSKIGNVEIEKLINFWLDKLNLNNIKKRSEGIYKDLNLAIDCFSEGEIQRLTLIRSFLQNKFIEIYDEPTSFLDYKNSKIVCNELRNRAANKILFVSTHNEDLINFADQIIEIN